MNLASALRTNRFIWLLLLLSGLILDDYPNALAAAVEASTPLSAEQEPVYTITECEGSDGSRTVKLCRKGTDAPSQCFTVRRRADGIIVIKVSFRDFPLPFTYYIECRDGLCAIKDFFGNIICEQVPRDDGTVAFDCQARIIPPSDRGLYVFGPCESNPYQLCLKGPSDRKPTELPGDLERFRKVLPFLPWPEPAPDISPNPIDEPSSRNYTDVGRIIGDNDLDDACDTVWVGDFKSGSEILTSPEKR